MRERFNLNVSTLDRFTMLLHGNFGAGKTHLLGDMLRSESKRGPVLYINIKGEDGHLSISGMELGDVGYTVDSIPDLKELLLEAKQANIRAIGMDGFKELGAMVIRKVCGDKLPSVGKGSDDWQRIHKEFDDLVKSFRTFAPIFVAACSSDRSMDQITGEISLTPDLPGRQAAGVAGMFDFVFIVKAQATNPTTVKRTLLTAPTANTIIRQRLPKPLPNEIDLPSGGGGWDKLMAAMHACLTKEKR